MKYSEVLAAVRAYMSPGSHASATEVVIRLADQSGIDIQPNSWSGYRRTKGQLFDGQVRRALNQLADGGELIKRIETHVGRKKEAVYYTPDVLAQREADRNARIAAAERRRELVEQRLDDHGLQGLMAQTHVTLDDWEKILDRLEES